MSRKKHEEEHENLERWLVSYADFITLLFAFFTVLYATSQVDQKKLEEVVEAMNAAFEGGSLESILDTVGFKKPVGQTTTFVPPSMEVTVRPDMSGFLSNNPVQMGRVNQSLRLDLPERILFANGSADLYPAAYPILGEIADALSSTPARLQVTGHANAVPVLESSAYGDNMGLATARALSTVRYLNKRGMKIEQLVAAGQVCTDTWPDARAVTLQVHVEQLGVSGEVMERLQKTSLGDKWN